MEEVWVEYHRNYWANKFGVYRLRNVYEVSNFGRIRINGEIVELKPHRTGYLRAPGLFIYLHRLVAEMFIPNPENKPYVDHIDTNKLNNRADNLQWVTNSENMRNPTTIKHLKDSLKIKRESGTYKKSTACFKGEKNPRYGDHYFWIHLGDKKKQVTADYLDYWLDDGWNYGYNGTKLKKLANYD